MKSVLVPKQIMDKNGVLTTRNVKVDPTGGKSSSSLPAPVLAAMREPEVSREQLIEDVAKIISTPPANPTRYTRTPSASSVARELEDFQDEEVIKSIGDTMTSPTSNPYLKSLITSAFYNGDPNLEGYLKTTISVGDIHRTIEQYGGQMEAQLFSDTTNLFGAMGFKDRDFKGEVTDEHIGYFKATLIANKLGIQESGYPIKNVYYRQIENIRENLDRIVPALPVLVPVLSRDYYRQSFDDFIDVMDTIDRSGHDPKDIGDVMRERGTNDFAIVDEILNNGVKSMSSGVL